ncbi:MAG: hypothetical protein R3F60_21890 [bacterium]
MKALRATVWLLVGLGGCGEGDAIVGESCLVYREVSWTTARALVREPKRPPGPLESIFEPLAAGVCVRLPGPPSFVRVAAFPDPDSLAVTLLREPTFGRPGPCPGDRERLHLPFNARLDREVPGLDVSVVGGRAKWFLDTGELSLLILIYVDEWIGAVEIVCSLDGKITTYALWDPEASGPAVCAEPDERRSEEVRP